MKTPLLLLLFSAFLCLPLSVWPSDQCIAYDKPALDAVVKMTIDTMNALQTALSVSHFKIEKKAWIPMDDKVYTEIGRAHV